MCGVLRRKAVSRGFGVFISFTSQRLQNEPHAHFQRLHESKTQYAEPCSRNTNEGTCTYTILSGTGHEGGSDFETCVINIRW